MRPSSRQCPQEQWRPVAGSRNAAIVLPWPPTPRPQVPRPGRLAWVGASGTRVLLPLFGQASGWAAGPEPTSTPQLTKDPMHRGRRSETGPKEAKPSSDPPIPRVPGADSEKGPRSSKTQAIHHSGEGDHIRIMQD